MAARSRSPALAAGVVGIAPAACGGWGVIVMDGFAPVPEPCLAKPRIAAPRPVRARNASSDEVE